MAMTPIVLEAVIMSDVLKHQAAGSAYYIMGGGTAKPEGSDAAFNVREINLTSIEIPDGVDAESFVLPGGLVLIGAEAETPQTGKKVRITIEEIVV